MKCAKRTNVHPSTSRLRVTPKISKTINIKQSSVWKGSRVSTKLPEVSDIRYKTLESTHQSRFGRHYVGGKNTSVRTKSTRRGKTGGWTDTPGKPPNMANYNGRNQGTDVLNEALHSFFSAVTDTVLSRGSPAN
jgi:hypothetical protein